MRDPDTGKTTLVPEGPPPTGKKRIFVGTDDWELRQHTLTALASVELPSGTALALVVPFARVGNTRVAKEGEEVVGTDAMDQDLTESTDAGIGDIELRLRQDLRTALGLRGRFIPRTTVSLGASAPTGHFIIDQGLDDEAKDMSRYVSVGRGVWWALYDVDVFGRIFDRLGYMAQFGGRYPFGTVSNSSGFAFRWGPETRLNVGLTGVLWPGLVSASVTADMEWRKRGQERATANSPFEDFDNGGGNIQSLSTTIQVLLGGGFSLTANLRAPLRYEVYGTQPVPGIGALVALGYSHSIDTSTPAAPATAAKKGATAETELVKSLLVPGKVTIIDYWATWCEPCKRLAPLLEAFAASRDDVVLRKIDATDWNQAKMNRELPGVAGLPVVDIYGADGHLIERLVGTDCFDFAARVPSSR